MRPVWKRSLWIFAAMAVLGSAPATAESVECDGVGWPLGYVPVAATLELPSHRLELGAKIEFPVHRLPPVDIQKLLDEDEANTGWRKSPRVGVNRPLIGSLTGSWYDLSDGGRLWAASIVAEGASELRLHFVDVNVPPNAEIYVYSPQNPDRGVGPYAEAGPLRSGDFWAGAVTGDTAHIEYYVPNGGVVALPFGIDEVGYMYRQVGAGRGARSWGDCMVDVPCEPDWPLWQDVSYSVARITFYCNDPPDPAGWYICTGQLLATLNADLTPYFLTSAHCIDEQSEADSVEFQWFYQHSSCGGGLMSSIYCDDAELLGTSGSGSGADWSLLMVKGVLPPDVFWSGWMTTNPSSGTWSVAVHHPNDTSDWKRWSRGQRYAGLWNNYHELHFDAAGAVGHIYYGSSGSGIWRESDQKLFGNLSFGIGEPGCDHLSTDAYYGRFANYYSSISSYLAAGSDDTYEDNDSCANAATLDDGSFSDLVVKGLDEDWYRIPLGQGQELDLDLFFTHSYGNINAVLYDGCGGSVVASGATYTNNEYLSYVNAGPAADFYLRVFLKNDVRNAYDMDCTRTGDGEPPLPNPMAFATPPYALDPTSIHMVASVATDLSSPPVEYYFDFISGGAGGCDGGWQTSTEYTDDGLQPDTNYCYRVKARDSASVPNETEFSATQCADTMPLVIVPPVPENSLGITDCTSDDDCARAARCVSGICYAPKHRYISIAQNPAQAEHTARRISLEGGGAGPWWVGAPYEAGGLTVADVVDAPAYADSDFTGEWPDLVNVTGCEIAPNQTYLVQAIAEGQQITEEANYSAAIALHTPEVWGDVVSTCMFYTCQPPQGEVNIDDILAGIGAFQSKSSDPLTWFDLAPALNDGVPNQEVDIDDILANIQGFKSQPYPGLGPLDCP